MMKNCLKILCVALLGTASAVATAADATLVLYRLGSANLRALSAVVTSESTELARLRGNSFAEISLPAGRHVLAAKALGYASSASVELELAAGERLYYEVRPNTRRPSLFAAAVPVVGEASIAAEAASSHPFLFQLQTEEAFLAAQAKLKPARRP